MDRVGFWPRVGATLIDAVILFAIALGFGLIFGFSSLSLAIGAGNVGVSASSDTSSAFTLALIIYLISVAYSSLEIFAAATPGKMALKFRIRSEDGSDGTKQVLAKRWAIKNSSLLMTLLAVVTTIALFSTIGSIAGLIIGIGCLFVLSDDCQALHDKLAKTAVYRS